MEMSSQNKNSPKKNEPIIETEIFDTNLPSELLESTAPNTSKSIVDDFGGKNKEKQVKNKLVASGTCW